MAVSTDELVESISKDYVELFEQGGLTIAKIAQVIHEIMVSKKGSAGHRLTAANLALQVHGAFAAKQHKVEVTDSLDDALDTIEKRKIEKRKNG